MKSLFIVLGVLAWVLAANFGWTPLVRAERVPIQRVPGDSANALQSYDLQNLSSAGAALGFSIAGGMCFIAAAIIDRKRSV
ncbi:MAG: hypothetical protein K8U57_01355 [Planctomycetes bacterium]|nr:hypothetical protein [Planctomycetota bacterium]